MRISDYQKAYDSAMRECKPNYQKSFSAWQKEASLTHKAIALAEQIYETKQKKIREVYAKDTANKMLAEEQARLLEFKKDAEADIRAKLDVVVSSKNEAIRKAAGAPSESDLRLLQALKMRTSLTENDIIHAAQALDNNLTSFEVLQDIANSHRINVTMPTIQKFEDKLNCAVSYCNDMLKELSAPDSSLSYKGIEFFLYPDNDTGFAVDAFHDLDNSTYSAEAAKKTVSVDDSFVNAISENYGAAKVKLTGLNPNAIEIKLTGEENITNLLYQFNVEMDDIMKYNPGTDVSSLGEGDRLIIPASNMKVIKKPGFVNVDQCTPIEVPM